MKLIKISKTKTLYPDTITHRAHTVDVFTEKVANKAPDALHPSSEEESKNAGIFNSARRSIYAKWPEPERRSMLEGMLYPRNYLNQAGKGEESSTLKDLLKPIAENVEQSRYLQPKSVVGDLRRGGDYAGAGVVDGHSTNLSVAEKNAENARDVSMKAKIALIVDQTLRDSEARLKTIAPLKDKFKTNPAFKIGFILIMIKKSRDVMNELFNVAVKHREQWQALEQLKIFELIIHTNADTSTLVQQLYELHSTAGATFMPADGKSPGDTEHAKPERYRLGGDRT